MLTSPEFESGFITVRGKKLHYIKKGKGKPMLLLHGLGMSSEQWKENIDKLAKNFTVYAFDFIGSGYSDPLESGSEVNMNFAPPLIDRVRKKLGITEKIVLLGGSFGGLLALHYAYWYPDNIEKLIIMDSAGLGKEINMLYRLATLPLVGEFYYRLDFWLLAKDNTLLSKLAALPGIGDFIAEFHSKYGRSEEEEEVSASHKTILKLLRYGVGLWGQKDSIMFSKDQLKSINVETLIMWGSEDDIFPLKHGKRAANLISKAKLYIFKGAGHWPPSERVDEFTKVVTEFALS